MSKACLLSSLEPLLAWSFAEHTVPPAFHTRAEQVRGAGWCAGAVLCCCARSG